MIRPSSLPRVTLACLAAFAAARDAAAATPAPLAPAGVNSPDDSGHDAGLPAGEASGDTAAPADGSREGPPTQPKELGKMVEFGTRLVEAGDFAGAESAFRHVLASASAAPEEIQHALRGLANLFRRQGALTKAVAVYERCLKEYPADEHMPDVLLDLGRALRALGAHRLALARFYSVINSTLKLPSADFGRYQALAKTAQYEIAETYFESGNYTEAVKFYARLSLVELVPKDAARVQFKTARAQKLQGDLAGAVVLLRAFLERAPADDNAPEARYLLATALQELGRPQEAFTATLELLQGARSDSVVHAKRWEYWQRRTGNQLANHFFEAGDVLNAQAIYSGLLEVASEPAWKLPLSYQLGLCFERLGQAERARTAYQTIVDAAAGKNPPDSAELVRMAAWRLEHLNWRERTAQQVSSLFEADTGRQANRANSAIPHSSNHAPERNPPGT